MAEENEKKPDEKELEQVNSFIREQTRLAFEEIQKEQAKQVDDKPVETKVDDPNAQLREVLQPIFQGDLDSAKLTAQGAMDYVDFYTSNPEAVELKEQIEGMFQTLAQAGRATSRRDIYKYQMGELLQKDPDAFLEKMNAKKKAQVEKAEVNSDFAAGGVTRQQRDTFENFSSLSLEEMEKRLEGITF